MTSSNIPRRTDASLLAPSSSASGNAREFVVPSEWGSITEFYDASSLNSENERGLRSPMKALSPAPHASHRTVVLIQDAHAVPDAQKSLMKLIGYFREKYGISSVALEGAEGELDPGLFKNFPDKDRLARAFEAYLDTGELSGAAAASVFAQAPARFIGIEDWNLYQENVSSFLVGLKQQPSISKQLAAISVKLQLFKTKYYTPEAREFDANVRKWQNDPEQFAPFIEHLLARRAVYGERSENYGTMNALFHSLSAEQTRDPEKEADVRKLAKYARDVAPSAELNALVQSYRTGGISLAALASQIMSLLKCSGKPVPTVPAGIQKMISDHETLVNMRGQTLSDELDAYVAAVRAKLFTTPEARAVDQLDGKLRLLRKLVQFELNRSEGEQIFVWGKTRGEWRKALPGAFQDTGNQIEVLLAKAVAFTKFYEIAILREAVFERKLDQMLQAPDAVRGAVVVTGGFHTSGLVARLKKQGIPYVIVSPAMKQVPQDNRYFDFMQGRVSWSKYFKPLGGRINLYDAFTRATVERLVSSRMSTNSAFGHGEDNAYGARSAALKEWRDEVIRDLAASGRVAQHSKYTRFIDEALLKDRASEFEARKAKWSAKFEKFIGNLRILKAGNRLNETNVSKLFQTPATQTFVGVASLDPVATVPGWFVSPEAPSSERGASSGKLNVKPDPLPPQEILLSGPARSPNSLRSEARNLPTHPFNLALWTPENVNELSLTELQLLLTEILEKQTWETRPARLRLPREQMALFSRALSLALRRTDHSQVAEMLEGLADPARPAFRTINFYPPAKMMLDSFLTVYRLPKGSEPTEVGIVFSMYGEQNRLQPASTENLHGEDLIAEKLTELDELFLINPSVKYRLLMVDDGERSLDRSDPADELRFTPLPRKTMVSPFWQWYVRFLSMHVRKWLMLALKALQKSQLEGKVPQPVIKVQKSSGEVAMDILRQKFPERLSSGQVEVRFVNKAEKAKIAGKKGSGILLGLRRLLETNAKYFIFTDADLATHLGQSGLLLKPLVEGKTEAAIGSRWRKGAVVTGRLKEELRGSFIYNMIAKFFLGFWMIRDTQCGFKGFTRGSLEALLPVDRQWRLDPDFTYDFAFDTHLLLRFRNSARKILEVPVVWIGSPEESTLSPESKVEAVLSMAKQIPDRWRKLPSEIRQTVRERWLRGEAWVVAHARQIMVAGSLGILVNAVYAVLTHLNGLGSAWMPTLLTTMEPWTYIAVILATSFVKNHARLKEALRWGGLLTAILAFRWFDGRLPFLFLDLPSILMGVAFISARNLAALYTIRRVAGEPESRQASFRYARDWAFSSLGIALSYYINNSYIPYLTDHTTGVWEPVTLSLGFMEWLTCVPLGVVVGAVYGAKQDLSRNLWLKAKRALFFMPFVFSYWMWFTPLGWWLKNFEFLEQHPVLRLAVLQIYFNVVGFFWQTIFQRLVDRIFAGKTAGVTEVSPPDPKGYETSDQERSGDAKKRSETRAGEENPSVGARYVRREHIRSQRPWILVVDDDPDMRLALRSGLRGKYFVEAMANEEDALAGYKADPDLFDLVILDLDLKPGETDGGLRLMDAIRAIRPAQKVVLMSIHPRVRRLALQRDVPSFYKLAGIPDISRTVESVIGREPEGVPGAGSGGISYDAAGMDIRTADSLAAYMEQLKHVSPSLLGDEASYSRKFLEPLFEVLFYSLERDFEDSQDFVDACRRILEGSDALELSRLMRWKEEGGPDGQEIFEKFKKIASTQHTKMTNLGFYGLLLSSLAVDRSYLYDLHDKFIAATPRQEISLGRLGISHHLRMDSVIHSYPKTYVYESDDAEGHLYRHAIHGRLNEKPPKDGPSENTRKIRRALDLWERHIGELKARGEPYAHLERRLAHFKGSATVLELGMRTHLLVSEPDRNVVRPVHVGRTRHVFYLSKQYLNSLDLEDDAQMRQLALWLNSGESFLELYQHDALALGEDPARLEQMQAKLSDLNRMFFQNEDSGFMGLPVEQVRDSLAALMREDVVIKYMMLSRDNEYQETTAEEVLRSAHSSHNQFEYAKAADIYGLLLFRYESLEMHRKAYDAFRKMAGAIDDFHKDAKAQPGVLPTFKQIDLVLAALRFEQWDDFLILLKRLLTGEGMAPEETELVQGLLIPLGQDGRDTFAKELQVSLAGQAQAVGGEKVKRVRAKALALLEEYFSKPELRARAEVRQSIGDHWTRGKIENMTNAGRLDLLLDMAASPEKYALLDAYEKLERISKLLSLLLRGEEAGFNSSVAQNILSRGDALMPELKVLIKSYLSVYHMRGPANVAVVVSMYGEQNRLRPWSEANPHGEDAVRRKLEQMEDLFAVNPDLSWKVIYVDDGEYGASNLKIDGAQPSSGDVAFRTLKLRFPQYLENDQAKVVFVSRPVKSELDGKKATGVISGLRGSLSWANYSVFTDTDISTHLGQLGNLLAPLAEGKADAAIGSRKAEGASVGKKSFLARLGSAMARLGVKFLVGLDIGDTQAGFKAFTSEILERPLLHGGQVLPLDRAGNFDRRFVWDFSFDMNLLGRILAAGGKILEVPIVWVGSPEESQVKLKDRLYGILSILEIRQNLRNPVPDWVPVSKLALEKKRAEVRGRSEDHQDAVTVGQTNLPAAEGAKEARSRFLSRLVKVSVVSALGLAAIGVLYLTGQLDWYTSVKLSTPAGVVIYGPSAIPDMITGALSWGVANAVGQYLYQGRKIRVKESVTLGFAGIFQGLATHVLYNIVPLLPVLSSGAIQQAFRTFIVLAGGVIISGYFAGVTSLCHRLFKAESYSVKEEVKKAGDVFLLKILGVLKTYALVNFASRPLQVICEQVYDYVMNTFGAYLMSRARSLFVGKILKNTTKGGPSSGKTRSEVRSPEFSEITRDEDLRLNAMEQELKMRSARQARGIMMENSRDRALLYAPFGKIIRAAMTGGKLKKAELESFVELAALDLERVIAELNRAFKDWLPLAVAEEIVPGVEHFAAVTEESVGFKAAHPDFEAKLSGAAAQSIIRMKEDARIYLEQHPKDSLNFAFVMPMPSRGVSDISKWLLDYIRAIQSLKMAFGSRVGGDIRILTRKENLDDSFVRAIQRSGVSKIIELDGNASMQVNRFLSERHNGLVFDLPAALGTEIDPGYSGRLVRLDRVLWADVYPVATPISFQAARVDQITAELLGKLPQLLPENSVAFRGGQLVILEAVRQLILEAVASKIFATMA